MNKTSTLIIGVLALIGVVLSSVAIVQTRPIDEPRIGATATLDGVDNPYVSINGVKTYYYNQNIAATSSILCSVRNPFPATSTLRSYTANITTNGFGITQTLDISTSSSAYASSSPAFVKAFIAPTGKFSVIWNPSATTSAILVGAEGTGQKGYSDVIIGPSEFINFRISTATPGTVASPYLGTCKGLIQAL